MVGGRGREREGEGGRGRERSVYVVYYENTKRVW
jgi:hypothetical protein